MTILVKYEKPGIVIKIVISSQNGSFESKVHKSKAKRGKRKVQGVAQLQTAALPRHEEEEETDKIKQMQIEQTHEKH